jgi:hypothetical protein
MIEDLKEEVNNTVSEAVHDNMKQTTAAAMGLDSRSYYGAMWYSSALGIAVDRHTRTLDYYGGFEYVKDRTVLGDWTFYGIEDSRVREHLYRVLSEEEGRELAARYDEEEEYFPEEE